jgi:putative glutamine amidotransferase
MTAPLPRVAMPVRLSSAVGADARVGLANRIFDDVAMLARAEGLDVVAVDGTAVDGFDGVVLPGGGDVDPALYDGDASALLYDVNPAQDALDLGIARAALEAGIPVLGVCRGMQVLNVVRGGSLVEDLPATDVAHGPGGETGPGAEVEWEWHSVTVSAGSRLGVERGEGRMLVASGHHQAVRRLGEGLTAVATADDGLVEAFEDDAHDVLGVQWHPEATGTPAPDARAPFAVFAAAVRRRAAGADR